MIFYLLFDVKISFLYRKSARLFSLMLSYKGAKPVFKRCFSISFVDLTDSDEALPSTGLEGIRTKEESSCRNGFPSCRNAARKDFLSFRKAS